MRAATPDRDPDLDLRAIAMGVTFAALWASAFATGRLMVLDAPPLALISLRLFLTALVGMAIASALGQSWRLSRGQFRATMLFGLGQNGIYLGANFVALSRIEASLAAIIASSMPLLVAMASWAIWRERQRPLGVFGLLAGFAGVITIMGARIEGGADLIGILLCVAGAMALTFATLMVRGATAGGGNVLMIVSLQMLAGAVVLAPISLAIETLEVRWSVVLVVTFFYSAAFPGLIATLLWFLLVRRIGATRAATFHFLNPAFGVMSAAILLGEGLGPTDLIGVVVVMIGILAVQLSRAAPRPPPPAA